MWKKAQPITMPPLIDFNQERKKIAFIFVASLVYSNWTEAEQKAALEHLKETDVGLLFLVTAILQEINRGFTNKVQA
jgi:hypothetical protein